MSSMKEIVRETLKQAGVNVPKDIAAMEIVEDDEKRVAKKDK